MGFQEQDLASGQQANASFLFGIPGNALSMIFSSISQSDFLRCMGVCRTWREALPKIYCGLLWSGVALDGTQDYMENRPLFLSCLGPHVKQVTIDYAREEGNLEALLLILDMQGCAGIEHLTILSHCYLWPGVDQYFPDLLGNVTDLRIQGAHFGIEPFDLLADIIAAAPHLTIISILVEAVVLGSDADLHATLQGPRVNPNVKYLRFGIGNYFHGNVLQDLEPILQSCPNLTGLHVKIPPVEVAYDLGILGKCTKLTSVNLVQTLGDLEIGIQKALDPSRSSGLSELYVPASAVTSLDDNASRDLKVLSIEGMDRITDASVVALLKICLRLRTLRLTPIDSLLALDAIPACVTKLSLTIWNRKVLDGLAAFFRSRSDQFEAVEVANIIYPHAQPSILKALAGLPKLRDLAIAPFQAKETDLVKLVKMAKGLQALSIHQGPSLSCQTFDQIAQLPDLADLELICFGQSVSGSGIRLLADKKNRATVRIGCLDLMDDPSAIDYARQLLGKDRFFFLSGRC